MVPAEIVISIIFGTLQLIVGLVSLWQQHYFRWAAHVEDEETLSENPIKLKPSRLEKVWA
ncbi:hypothetical protein FOVG_05717 [Fusarium oxysporum f. sp. pisi HDV247]|uniref:Uncharacterized protein n=1 Tax=Fusarium oxysporum f. sp. pisi HDV247 TaxID=1080344 RepID=W9PGA9_FUSOX|nr:hypothetical protein FOVG_05717 [Fusarium oxysporum f. sp. pisi HDV247]